jgi:type I restriction enzyme S subunit
VSARWTSTTLGEIAEIVSGATPSTSQKAYWDGGIRWATPKDLSDLVGPEIAETARTISNAGLLSCAATVLPANSVLLSSRAPIGLVAINRVPMATNQGFKSLVPDHGQVFAKYLFWWLRWNRSLLESLGNGATFKEISKKTTAAVPISLPPLEEQRRIASILDAADALRTKRLQALRKLDTLTQSIFIKVFGDPISNSKSWPLVPLGSLGCLERGVSKHRPRNDPRLLGGPYPLVQTGDVAAARRTISSASSSYSEFGLKQSRLWPAGTLCITIAANIGKTGVLGFESCFPDSVVGFAADPSTTEYVRVLIDLHQSRLEALAPESAQKNINLKVLRELMIPAPPAEELIRFHVLVAQIERCRQAAQAQADAHSGLLASLQYRAFRGEL